jgi:hypothetical protein
MNGSDKLKARAKAVYVLDYYRRLAEFTVRQKRQ